MRKSAAWPISATAPIRRTGIAAVTRARRASRAAGSRKLHMSLSV
jgi:hypothetical protein